MKCFEGDNKKTKYLKSEIVEESWYDESNVIDIEYLEIDASDLSHEDMKLESNKSIVGRDKSIKESETVPESKKLGIDKYKKSYNIRDLFSNEEMKKVATIKDIDDIFNRDFPNLRDREEKASLDLLKERCANLVNGKSTVEVIVFYYAQRYMQIIKKGQFDN